MNEANEITDTPEAKDETTICDRAPSVGLGEIMNVLLLKRLQIVKGVETFDPETFTSE